MNITPLPYKTKSKKKQFKLKMIPTDIFNLRFQRMTSEEKTKVNIFEGYDIPKKRRINLQEVRFKYNSRSYNQDLNPKMEDYWEKSKQNAKIFIPDNTDNLTIKPTEKANTLKLVRPYKCENNCNLSFQPIQSKRVSKINKSEINSGEILNNEADKLNTQNYVKLPPLKSKSNGIRSQSAKTHINEKKITSFDTYERNNYINKILRNVELQQLRENLYIQNVLNPEIQKEKRQCEEIKKNYEENRHFEEKLIERDKNNRLAKRKIHRKLLELQLIDNAKRRDERHSLQKMLK